MPTALINTCTRLAPAAPSTPSSRGPHHPAHINAHPVPRPALPSSAQLPVQFGPAHPTHKPLRPATKITRAAPSRPRMRAACVGAATLSHQLRARFLAVSVDASICHHALRRRGPAPGCAPVAPLLERAGALLRAPITLRPAASPPSHNLLPWAHLKPRHAPPLALLVVLHTCTFEPPQYYARPRPRGPAARAGHPLCSPARCPTPPVCLPPPPHPSISQRDGLLPYCSCPSPRRAFAAARSHGPPAT